MKYKSLHDPRGGLKNINFRYPAEPALGGSIGKYELSALIKAFNESSDIRVGFNAARETQALEERFCEYASSAYAVAVNGANSALDLIVRMLSVDADDEVISAAATFHGQHLSLLGVNAKLVLADIDEVDFCLSAASVRDLLTERTRLIVATDIHGCAADYRGIRKVIDEYGYPEGKAPIIVSDAARSIGSKGIVETMGYVDLAVFSLQSKKIITALGEGGVVVTNNLNFAERIREMRSFGHGRAWGSNFKISKLQAVVANAQMERLSSIVALRNCLAEQRIFNLRDAIGVIKPVIPLGRSHNFQFFPLVLSKDLAWGRDVIIEELAKEYSVGAVVANPPTYQYNSWIANRVSTKKPKTESLTDRLICLSFHHEYNDQDEIYICDSLLKVLDKVLM
ncbi:DegT/DnrJ/EryC1/StrS family aminotransferase [Pseudomonas citronellolis]|uniref:DegT/DnrJ/EryC1/StrS family aminotransferase n=1 Tax=Pseudomonas citronellolis TaxID=53408 RepID=UPI0009EED5D5|nr:DegT/DnrJ/EryC1/StrS family aminotransferase [Pseudomonas citronellolis]